MRPQSFALLAAALFAACGVACAEEACPAVLHLALPSVPNKREQQEDTPIRHVLDELIPEFARRAGTQIQLEFMPRVRAFAELRHGSVDLVPMATRTMERDGFAQMVVMGRIKAMLIMRKPVAPHPVSSDELLAGSMRVVVVRGQEFGPHFDALLVKLQKLGRLDSVADQLIAVRMLKAGHTDAILGLPAFFAPMLDTEGLAEQTEAVDGDLIESVDEGLYMSSKLPAACRARLQAAGETLRSNGFYRSLLNRFIPPTQRGAFID